MNTYKCTILPGANSSQINNQHITIRLPLLLINPFNNIPMFNIYQKKFKEMIPITPVKHHCHTCDRYKVKLNYTSNYLEQEIYVEVYNNVLDSSFIRRLDRFIINGYFSGSTKFNEKYFIILAASELYIKINGNRLNWINNFYDNFIQTYQHTPPFSTVFHQVYECMRKPPLFRKDDLPEDLKCMCCIVTTMGSDCLVSTSDNDLEETGLTDIVTNITKAVSCSLASTFYAFKAADYDITQISNDLLADLTLLATNFNVYTVVWAFVKVINRIVKLPNLFKIIVDLFKDTYSFIRSLISGISPQQQEESLESTFLDNSDCLESTEDVIIPPIATESQFNNFIKKLKDTSPIICACMATLVVIITSVLLGKSAFNHESMANKSQAKRVAEAFWTVSQTGMSIKNLFNILSEWPKWVKDTAFNLMLGEDTGPVSDLLSNVQVPTPENLSKSDFFERLSYLSNPTNLLVVSRNEELRKQLIWCDNVLNAMAKDLAQRPTTAIKPAAQQWLFTKLQHTRSSLMTIGRLPSSSKTRFIPFWLNIIGPAGCGKTTLAPMILNRLKIMLEKWKDHGSDETIPELEGDWMYSMNFCDKYMTGYHGQYSVVIDDLFQDASVIGDATPSALLLIQMVSSQPFHTIQASLDDKGTQFTSKFILSTSNDYNIDRKEIIDKAALIRRMNVRVEIEYDRKATTQEDQTLEACGMPQRIIFKVVDSSSRKLLYKYRFNELCIYIFSEYIKWYQLQKKILNNQGNVGNVDALIYGLSKGGSIPEIKTDRFEKLDQPLIRKTYQVCPGNFIVNSDNLTNPLHSHNINIEATQSIMCRVLGKPKVKLLQIPIARPACEEEIYPTIANVEQYDCDCDNCLYINRSFREHYIVCYGTIGLIPSIAEFNRWIVTAEDPIISDYNNLFKKFWELIKNIVTEASKHPIALILATVATGVSFWYMRTENFDETSVAYSSGPNAKKLKARVKIQPLKPIKLVQTNLSVECELRDALPDQNTFDIVTKLLGKESICVLRYYNDKQQLSCNTAVRIVDTCLLTNHHFMQNLKDGQMFEVIIYHRTIGQTIRQQIFNSRRYSRLNSLDAGVYQCDNHIPHCASIINNFTEDEIPDMDHYSVVLSILDPDKLICPVVIPGVLAKPHKKQSVYGNFSALDTFSTNLPVKKGQSGSLLISTEPSSKNKILGIQVCRDKQSNIGYFKPVSRKMLIEAIDMFKIDENLEDTIEEDVEQSSATWIIPSNTEAEHNSLKYLGRISHKKQISQAITTKYLPSLIQDKSILKFEPAVLHSKDERMNEEFRGRSIIFRSLKGFDESIGCVDTQQLDIACEELSIDLINNMKLPLGHSKQLLNEYQMINGVKPYLKKIDMRTSPGFPYVKQKEPTDYGKYKWFVTLDDIEKTYEMKDELRIIVNKREELALQGIKSSTVAYACLKDEVRPINKIKEGKTRIFQCLPMDFNLLIRKYFGSFVIAQHYNAANISSCVGIDPAKDWYKLRLRLEEKALEWEDFDYAHWDQHLHGELVMKVADVVNAWYGDAFDHPHARVRRVLLYDLVYTILMVKDHLYMKSTGQCSGCSITAELNCIIHDLLMYYTFRRICKDKNQKCDIQIYRDNVASAIYGDDIVTAVTSAFVQIFNGNTIKPYMEMLGMSITPGDKESSEFIHKKPEKITFLKRTFTTSLDNPDFQDLDQSNSRAPLKKDIVDNIWQWASKADDLIKPTEQNCETSLREYFMFGRKVFNAEKERINQRISEYNLKAVKPINLISMSYDNLLSEYEGGDFITFGQQENTVSFDFLK
nr:MAG: RNA-dependent RNA polymerase [Avian associated picorna-like virus 23]